MTTPTPVDEVTVVTELRVSDRCERCGAQAFVRVLIPDSGTWDFCKHHFEAQGDGLIKAGAVIVVDRRSALDPSA